MTTIDRRDEFDDARLQACLSAIAARTHGGLPEIATVQWRPFDGTTSFDAEILTIEMVDGASLTIYVKDLSQSRLPKLDLERRRERERRVYRELLDKTDLTTPKYYGAVWEKALGRYWLLIEFVPGVLLRDLGFEQWVLAAAWLGRLHGAFKGQAACLDNCKFLAQHDTGFFSSVAESALTAVAHYSTDLCDRMTTVLRGHDRIINVMAAQPKTLVHGSYRTQNILVDLAVHPARIAPVDWELAAVGAPYYDLAFITDGFSSPRLQLMLAAYCQQAKKHGLDIPEEGELIYLVYCFRLQKILKSLSDSVMLGFKEQTVVKLIGMAEDVAQLVRA